MIEYVEKIYHECELADFPAWGGAVAQLERLKEHPAAFKCIEEAIYQELIDEGEVSAEYINDLLWYELEGVLDYYGLYDFDTDTILDEPYWKED